VYFVTAVNEGEGAAQDFFRKKADSCILIWSLYWGTL